MSDPNTQSRLRLYLIRHGEIETAAIGKLIGRTDVGLSERGIEQASRIAERLSSVRFDAIYSSDLLRARQTAEIISERCQVSVQPFAAWREIDMGSWEGRTISALNDEAPEKVSSLFIDPASFTYPSGESFAAFAARVQGALDQLLMTHSSGEVALIAHGGVSRAIIGGALEIPLRNWLRLAQNYGCLNVINWYDLHPVLELLNYDFGSLSSIRR